MPLNAQTARLLGNVVQSLLTEKGDLLVAKDDGIVCLVDFFTLEVPVHLTRRAQR